MKIVVIVGGGRRVGKTTLATKLVEVLPGSTAVKLGDHARKEEKTFPLLPRGTAFKEVLEKVAGFDFLVIESGAILDDPDLNAHLVIFLPAPDGREDKPGSRLRRSRADMVRGESIARKRADELSSRLGIDREVFETIAVAAGVEIVD